MARKRPLHRYPAEYYELFEAAQERAVELKFPTENKAAAFRIELYNLRSQVREALSHDPSIKELGERLLLMENIEILLRGNSLHLRRKRPYHEHVIREALDAASTSTS